MKAFLAGLAAAILIAVIAGVVLDFAGVSSDEAGATGNVRLPVMVPDG